MSRSGRNRCRNVGGGVGDRQHRRSMLSAVSQQNRVTSCIHCVLKLRLSSQKQSPASYKKNGKTSVRPAISYMGTKKRLAPKIAEIIARAPSGPLLDLFSGVGTIGESVGLARPVWLNDTQEFSCLINRCLFQGSCYPARNFDFPQFEKLFQKQKLFLESENSDLLSTERGALRGSPKKTAIAKANNALRNATAFNEARTSRKPRKGSRKHHSLFSKTYAGTYLSLEQCMDVDAISFACSKLLKADLISEKTHDWALLALCEAISGCATTTGHFAQFLDVNPNNLQRYAIQRTRNLHLKWSENLKKYRSLGTYRWRKTNRVINGDAIKTLENINSENGQTPSVIYADPPYTDDQYSRYYHLLETAILYDHPTVSGKARYRNDRFRSNFCLKTKAVNSIDAIASGAKNIGATLVLSYPTVGLIDEPKTQLLQILGKHMTDVKIALEEKLGHSSMGASKGNAKVSATEMVMVGTP